MSGASPRLAMPYPGLRPFEAEDQALFFGREAQIGAILRQLEDHRFVAVVGSSGSGKSSLVRAGLVPAVHEGFLLGTTRWLTLTLKPGHQPYERLARKLQRATQAGTDAAARPAPGGDGPGCLPILRQADRGLLDALDHLNVAPDTHVMVVVDQFEEIFAFRRARIGRDQAAPRDEAAAFVRMLLQSSADPRGRIWVVLTMRSDFIGDCEAFLGLPEAVSRSQFLVPRLDRGQMKEAICRPSEVREGAFQPFAFEDGLVNRMINDAGDRPDQLPLLQHALMRTWKLAARRAARTGGAVQLTSDDYRAAGGIEHALSLHADAAWQTLADDPVKARIARHLFLLLCDVSPEGQITRRRPRLAGVVAVASCDAAAAEQVIRLFQDDDRNFLLPPREEGLSLESYLDVSHEALLRQWETYRKWQEEERLRVAELRRLAEQAGLAEQGKGGPLTADDLPRVAAWLKETSREWALRYVAENHWNNVLAFVSASRTEVERQARGRRTLLLGTGFVLILATVVSIALMWQARIAKDQAVALAAEKAAAEATAHQAATNAIALQKQAEAAARKSETATAAASAALTKTFTRTIGFSYNPSPDEMETLWELAELPRANEIVRENVLAAWFRTRDSLAQVLVGEGMALRAASGISLKRRERIAGLADALAGKVLAETAAASPNFFYRPMSLFRVASNRDTWEFLRGYLRPATAAEQTPALLGRLQVLSPEDLLGQPEWWEAAAAAVARLADDQLATEAATLATRLLLGEMENEEAIASDQLKAATDTLGSLVRHLDAQAADAAFARAAAAVFARIESGPAKRYDYESIRQALTNLPVRMDGAMEAAAARCANTLAARITSATNWADRMDLCGTLATLTARMETTAAAPLAGHGAEAIVRAFATEPDEGFEWGRSNVLGALAARMDPQHTAALAGQLTRMLEGSTTNAEALGEGLAAVSTWISPGTARAQCDRLLGLLEAPASLDYRMLRALGIAFDALAVRLDDPDLRTIAEQIVASIQDANETNAHWLSVPAEMLPKMLGPMTNKAAASTIATRGAAGLVLLMETNFLSSYTICLFAQSLTGAVVYIEEKPVACSVAIRATTVLARAMQDTNNASLLPDLAAPLARLAARADGQAASNAAAGAGVVFENLMGLARSNDVASTRPQRVYLGEAFLSLTAQMDPRAAAAIAARGSELLLQAMPLETGRERIELGAAVAELAKFMERDDAARAAAQGLWLLITNAPRAEGFRSYDGLEFANTVAALALRVPAAKPTRLWALNRLMEDRRGDAMWGATTEDSGNRLAGLISGLTAPELAGILKWPVCVGDAERIVLRELEQQTGRKFDGDVWKFAAQAGSLGITDLEGPAERPRAEAALQELKSYLPVPP